MSETIYNMGNHLKTGEWVIYGVCKECKEGYIMQTNKKPRYCPVCGSKLGLLCVFEEDEE